MSTNPTTTTLSVTPNPSTCGQSVTVCATITPAPGTTSVPTGQVTFTLPNSHTALGGKPPISRVNNAPGQYT